MLIHLSCYVILDYCPGTDTDRTKPDSNACRLVGLEGSEALRKRLLEEAGVAVLADIHFGEQVEGDGEHVRFSYASSLEDIDKGLTRIADFIRRNKR